MSEEGKNGQQRRGLKVGGGQHPRYNFAAPRSGEGRGPSWGDSII